MLLAHRSKAFPSQQCSFGWSSLSAALAAQKSDLVRDVRSVLIRVITVAKGNSQGAAAMAKEWLDKAARYTDISEVQIKPNPKKVADPEAQMSAEAEKVKRRCTRAIVAIVAPPFPQPPAPSASIGVLVWPPGRQESGAYAASRRHWAAARLRREHLQPPPALRRLPRKLPLAASDTVAGPACCRRACRYSRLWGRATG